MRAFRNRKAPDKKPNGKAPGYTRDGESEFTRHSAQPHENTRFKVNPRFRFRGSHTLAEQIRECESRIKFMECEQRIETDPRKLKRLAHDLGIRYRFLTKLLLEKEGSI